MKKSQTKKRTVLKVRFFVSAEYVLFAAGLFFAVADLNEIAFAVF